MTNMKKKPRANAKSTNHGGRNSEIGPYDAAADNAAHGPPLRIRPRLTLFDHGRNFLELRPCSTAAVPKNRSSVIAAAAAVAVRHLPCKGHGSAQPPSTSTPSGNASMRRKSMAAEPSRRPNHAISSPCPASRKRWRCVSCHRRTILIPTLEFSPRPDEVRISSSCFY